MHVGLAALVSAAAVTTFNVTQAVLASSNPASSFVSVVPCRLIDTRADSIVGTRGTPVSAGETVTFQVTGSHGNCVVPSTATSIATNVTIDNPTASSYLRIFPGDAAPGQSSNLNWHANIAPVANQVTVGLSPDGAIKVYNHAGSVDVVVDISGYFEPSSAGPQGDKGDTGDKGDKGDTGAKGDTGDAVFATLSCAVGQTITMGASGDWECTNPPVDTDTLASLSCTTNQSVRWSGTEWECRNEPIVAILSRASGSSPCCGIDGFFDNYSPNVDVNYSSCDENFCTIRLVDVIDHTSCQVNVTGYSYAPNAYISQTTSEIFIDWYYYNWSSEPLYVNISCNT
jgi:hypothetical protein